MLKLLGKVDFKLDTFLIMPQFDSLIIFPLVWSLLLTLMLYYSLSLKVLIPDFFRTKKFREKKMAVTSFSTFFKKNVEVQRSGSYYNLF
jgi:hypothetical protein